MSSSGPSLPAAAQLVETLERASACLTQADAEGASQALESLQKLLLRTPGLTLDAAQLQFAKILYARATAAAERLTVGLGTSLEASGRARRAVGAYVAEGKSDAV